MNGLPTPPNVPPWLDKCFDDEPTFRKAHEAAVLAGFTPKFTVEEAMMHMHYIRAAVYAQLWQAEAKRLWNDTPWPLTDDPPSLVIYRERVDAKTKALANAETCAAEMRRQ